MASSTFDQSGVEGSAIVLPKGGGALRGIGETFSPDLQSGSYQVSVPVPVPPGRRGFTPTVALSYSSGRGNGPLGVGWELPVPAVTRAVRKGIPAYGDDDLLLLDGVDLVAAGPWRQDGSEGSLRAYRMPGTRAFDQVLRRRASGDEWWEVTTSDGVRSEFGRTALARIADGPRVFSWLVTSRSDPAGNEIRYDYLADGPSRQVYLARIDYTAVPEDVAPGGWLYSAVFDYGDLDADLGADLRRARAPGIRPDPFSNFRAGFEVRTRWLCRRILTVLNGTGQRGVVTEVALRYQRAGGNGASLLVEVARRGTSPDAEPQPEAPITFEYSPWTPSARATAIKGAAPALGGSVELVDRDGGALAGIASMTRQGHAYYSNDGAGNLTRDPAPLSGPRHRFVGRRAWLLDMTGDGYPDLAYFGPAAAYHAFIPGTGWATTATAAPCSVDWDPEQENGRFADLDGDGRIDAIRVGRRHRTVEMFTNFGLGSDGRHRGWGAPGEDGNPPAAPVPPEIDDLDFRTGLHRLADLSGDGPVDLVEIHNPGTPEQGSCCRDIRYWPHLGNCQFGPLRTLVLPLPADGVDPLAKNFKPERLVLADFDGDGFDDVAYVRTDKVFVWLNQCGNAFDAPFVLDWSSASGTATGPGTGYLSSLRAVDWFGRGFAGLLWSTGRAEDPLSHAYLCATEKPYLLTRVDNHRGAHATVTYRSSVEDAMRDERAGAPWRTRTPFPVQVVARVEVHDHFSNTTTASAFTYHEGVWDGVEREFRGFARVEQDDTDESAAGSATDAVAKPIHRVTWFHVGASGDATAIEEPDLSAGQWRTPPGEKIPEAGPMIPAPPPTTGATRRQALRARRGLPARVEEFLATDGPGRRPYTVTEYAYQIRPEPTEDPASGPVFSVLHRGERTTQWERGHDPLTRVHAEMHHDDAGRALRTVDIAVPRNRDPYRNDNAAGPYLASCTDRGYAGPVDGRIRDRVAWQHHHEITASTESVPGLLANAEDGVIELRLTGAAVFRYDRKAPFDPLPVGQIVDPLPVGQIGEHGLTVRAESLVHTPESLAAVFADEPRAPMLPTNRPPWLVTDGSPRDWQGYPEGFKAAVARGGEYGGYAWYPDGADRPAGLWAVDGEYCYDHQTTGLPGAGYGLLVGARDAVGVTTDITPDELRMLPATVTRGGRLTQQATYDYRTQQPVSVVDENGGTTSFSFTPLGLLASVHRAGDGEAAADPESLPGIRYTYNLTASDHEPAWVEATTQLLDASMQARIAADIARIVGPGGPGLPLDAKPAIQRDYTDGLGRLLASRHLVTGPVTSSADTEDPDGQLGAIQLIDPGGEPLVRVEGWVAYDNKGRVIRRYEPFFDRGWAWTEQPGSALNTSPVYSSITRDPRGLPERITLPDGTHRRFIHGVPRQLDHPDDFTATPWESYEYDADDNAARTPGVAAAGLGNVDTPASVEIDALGRIASVTERDGSEEALTQIRYDIDGNVVEVIDALGRPSFRAAYDLRGRAWREWTLDGGTVLTIRDPLGQPVETRDPRGARTLDAYDGLHRLVAHWATNGSTPEVKFVESVAYGDDPAAPSKAAERGLVGRVWRRVDAAGMTEVEQYDAYGHEAVRTRSWLPIEGADIAWPMQADDANSESLFAGSVTLTERRDRRGSVWLAWTHEGSGEGGPAALYVRDSNGETREIYAPAKAEMTKLLGSRVLDARGHETALIDHGPVTSRLVRDRRSGTLTRRVTRSAALTGPGVIWDSQFAHSQTGLVASIIETTPASPDPHQMNYSYDGRGRLTRADGQAWRERGEPWELGEAGAGAATIEYQYDKVGNLVGSTLRAADFQERVVIEFDGDTNRVAALRVDRTGDPVHAIEYVSDAAGNIVLEGASRRFSWDHAQRAMTILAPSGRTDYAYNEDGVVRTLCKRGDSRSERHDLGGWVSVTPTVAGTQIAVLVTANGDSQGTPLGWVTYSRGADVEVHYLLTDHLGTVRATLRDDGSVVAARDMAPFGQTAVRTAPGDTGLPRSLGFALAEEEPVANLLRLGRREFAPWLGRFLSAESLADQRTLSATWLLSLSDPADPPDRRTPAWGLTSYAYAANSPLAVVDIGGHQSMTVDACRVWERRAGDLMGLGVGLLIASGLGLGVAATAVVVTTTLGVGDIFGEAWLAPAVCAAPASPAAADTPAPPSAADRQPPAAPRDPPVDEQPAGKHVGWISVKDVRTDMIETPSGTIEIQVGSPRLVDREPLGSATTPSPPPPPPPSQEPTFRRPERM